MVGSNPQFQAFFDGRLLAFDSGKREWTVLATIPGDWLQRGSSVKRVIEYIRAEFAPRILVDADAEWIIAIPPCGSLGFSCDLSGSSRERAVKILFGELEDDCTDLETALAWLARALSDDYQLRTKRSKNRILSARLEPVIADPSKPYIEMGYRLWPQWGRGREEVVRQNALASDLEQ